MNLQQSLKKCLMRWKEISGIDFCLMNGKNQVFATTSGQDLPEASQLDSFRSCGLESQRTDSFSMYRVSGENEEVLVLLVRDPGDPCPTLGKLAVCQVESLIDAHSPRNDRNAIMRDILLGHFPAAEICSQAKKMHINAKARRVVFLIRTSGAEESASETIRNLFISRSKDFFSALDQTSFVVVHELKDKENLNDADTSAHLLIDMLNTEAMIKAWVSYSNIRHELTGLPDSYKEALTAMEIGSIFHAGSNVFGYSHLGIGRLLYELPIEICEIFIDEILGKETLNTLDEETMNIIRTFFANNLNLSETSRKLYVHRNTLVYRLEKIEKKYGLDIRTFEDALTFKLAMLVTEYLNAKKTGP